MLRLETKDYQNFKLIDTSGNVVKEVTGYDRIKPAYPGDMLNEDLSIAVSQPKPVIVGLLHIKSHVKYGMTSRKVPIYFFEPLNPSYPCMIVGCSKEKDYTKNILVLVNFDSWDPKSKYPRGNMMNIIGPCGDLASEKKALLHRYSPWPHKKLDTIDEGYQQVLSTSRPIPGFTFNIDPPGCEDVDDVFTMEAIEDGWRLTISITDVAVAAPENSWISNEAKLVGQTLYPDNAPPKHMIPPAIGIKQLSLLPNKIRNVISLSLDWTSSVLSKPSWSLRTCSVDKAYIYDDADKETRAEMLALKRITEVIAGRTLDDSHQIVETCMLLYNKEAGRLLKNGGCGILRAHNAPDELKLESLKVIHSDLERYAFSSAKYVDVNSPANHWGLGTDCYAHASSPLRRYADLYNQQCIRQILLGQGQQTLPTHLIMDLNKLQKDAKAYDRDVFFINTLSIATSRSVKSLITEVDIAKQIIRVYVPKWQRIVRIKASLLAESDKIIYTTKDQTSSFEVCLGMSIMVSYYVNYDKRCWKDKIIFAPSLDI